MHNVLNVTTPEVSQRRAISPAAAVLALIVGTLVLRIAASAFVGLGTGESYYTSCAMRPDLSYFDQPPLAAWTAAASMNLTGTVGPLVLRVPFILMFAGTTWMIFLLGRSLFGEWAGFHAALLLNLSAVFTLSVASFYQPDGPLMFFWLACTMCLARIFLAPAVPRPYLAWCMVGLTLGLAMLSKYHAVFLGLGAGLFVLTTPGQRRWLWHPGPYLAGAIALAIFTPVLVWNAQHEWVSFLWQGGRGADYKGIRLDWLVRSIGGQALWLLPWIWLPLLLELPRGFSGGPKPANRADWFIVWMALPPILAFTAVAAYAPIGYHFHWQAPGYLLLFLMLGRTVARRLGEGHGVTRTWLRVTVVITIVSLLVLTTHSATGWCSAITPRWASDMLPDGLDPTLEALDYNSLPAALAQRGLLNDPNVFLFTNRWFQSGKVDYALRGSMTVHCLSPDPRAFAFFEPQEKWLGKDGILIGTQLFLKPEDVAGWYGQHFASIEPLGAVPVYRGGRVVETLHLYRCRGFHKVFPWPYGYTNGDR